MKHLKYLGLLLEVLGVMDRLKARGDVAELRPSYKGKKFEIVVKRVE